MRRLLLVFVLVAAFLGLLAAPAFAAEPYLGWPVTWMPNTAYVHPWGDPAKWEEMYWGWEAIDDPSDPDYPGHYDWIWTVWDTDTTPGPWWPPAEEGGDWIPLEFKAIPSSYDVWFVVWTHGAGPRGQYEALRGGLALDGYLKDADGETVWSTTVQEAMKFWSPAFQMLGWMIPTPNRGEQTEWAIAWTYHQGPMDASVYTGRGDYLIRHQMTAQYLAEPEQRGPIHVEWKGATSTFPDFSLTVQ